MKIRYNDVVRWQVAALALLASGCFIDNPAWEPAQSAENDVSGSNVDSDTAADGVAGTIGMSGAHSSGGTTTGDDDGPASSEAEGTTSDGDTGSPVEAPPEGCAPLPPPTGTVVHVVPAQADELYDLVLDAAPDTTFMLADGDYNLPFINFDTFFVLQIAQDGIALRSESGDPNSVRLIGVEDYDLIKVSADNFQIAEVSLVGMPRRAINAMLYTESDPIEYFELHNMDVYRVRIIDAETSVWATWAAGASLACSVFETTDLRRQTRDCSGAGVRLTWSENVTIRDNHFIAHWCTEPAWAPTIFAGLGTRGTRIYRNRFDDSSRAIWLGASPSADDRKWADNPCGDTPGVSWGHIEGAVVNNVVWNSLPAGGGARIKLAGTCNTDVLHNTAVSVLRSDSNPSIAHQYANTTGLIRNNILTHGIEALDGSTLEPVDNIVAASLEIFVDPPAGDLHLSAGAPGVDASVNADAAPVSPDFDGIVRDDPPSAGAFEVGRP